MQSIGTAYLQTVIRRLKQYKELGDRTFDQLSDENFHFTPNAESNSIAVIIRHVSGNMISRWTNFLTEDGEKPYRNRDEEFMSNAAAGKEALMVAWEKGWKVLLDTLASLTEEDLLKAVYIRQEPLLVIDAINRQLAHYPYHVGQIVYLGKMICGERWSSLSIPPGQSQQYNLSDGLKDPSKKF